MEKLTKKEYKQFEKEMNYNLGLDRIGNNKDNAPKEKVYIELTHPELMMVIGSLYNTLNGNAAPKELNKKFEKLVRKLENQLNKRM